MKALFKNDFSPSFRSFFTELAVRSALLSLLLGVAVATPFVLYFGKTNAEKHARFVSGTTAQAFREQILSGDIRYAEEQIRKTLSLSARENVVIRDAELNPIYSLGKDFKTSTCPEKAVSFCWHLSRGLISARAPIFYDASNEKLFGYLDVTLRPPLEFWLLITLLFSIGVAILVQTLGTTLGVMKAARTAGGRIRGWAQHLEHTPHQRVHMEAAPFSDLVPLHAAIEGLHGKISELENEARDSARMHVLRCIAHDIMNPIQQIQKYLYVHFKSLESGAGADSNLINDINRSLKKLLNIARQTKALHPESKVNTFEVTDLKAETEAILNDSARITQAVEKNIRFELQCENPSLKARMSPGDYQRIIDNLVSNAVDAVQPGGNITIRIGEKESRPQVRVSDDGVGIPYHLQRRVFDSDYSTKPNTGTGLGLPIVRELCLRNDTELEMVSQPGEGTKFSITFQPVGEESVNVV